MSEKNMIKTDLGDVKPLKNGDKKMSKEKIINMFFGNTPKQRFKRAIILLCAVSGMVFICLQVSCGFDRKGNFYFSVNPAATIDIEVKK